MSAASATASLGAAQTVVTISGVEEQIDGARWQALAIAPATVDLLSLKSGLFASLGITTLPVGHVTRLRLRLSGPHYVVSASGAHQHLKLSDGEEADVEVESDFELKTCEQGDIDVELDGESIGSTTLSSDAEEWNLHPVLSLQSIHGQNDESCAGGGVDGGPSSCLNVVCPTGQACANGVCVVTNPCLNVVCPTGQSCANGVCI